MFAENIFNELCKKNIYVRYFNDRRVNEYLRISIGKEDDMKVFIDTLKEIIEV